MSLDAIDRALLRRLQADGRTSYTDLAAEVGLTGPAARQRVQRMIDDGVLQITAVTDPLALGYPVMALLGITVERGVASVASAVAALDGVIYLVSTAGSFDLFAEVVCRDMGELGELIDKGIRAVRGVRAVESFPYFGIHAHRFTWDVPDP